MLTRACGCIAQKCSARVAHESVPGQCFAKALPGVAHDVGYWIAHKGNTSLRFLGGRRRVLLKYIYIYFRVVRRRRFFLV